MANWIQSSTWKTLVKSTNRLTTAKLQARVHYTLRHQQKWWRVEIWTSDCSILVISISEQLNCWRFGKSGNWCDIFIKILKSQMFTKYEEQTTPSWCCTTTMIHDFPVCDELKYKQSHEGKASKHQLCVRSVRKVIFSCSESGICRAAADRCCGSE